ncbi:large conductance mechanosensitive channel protein MscL [Candidatus Phytoplasma bonamiae]|uniref:Large conductance mechanosensitive channel protein MscL n=1 Tax=Candidatus Phytoplasma bonamiae TaxID=2982626 RepID=A0ABT9D781_9MOLU|nr:large conductance mechanosensitive channel protein MscL ['Bonamia sp.' little leaf phytoplasma]MDO8064064.1 large conductance mechanosensitive channel protein MscL ['Bonamia sp.' little leaf phytoplasma]MDV3174750.1 large conductance mechanosensitive channel protein MscL ['Bonamia sp.' little leaf phytoplasma]
MSSEKINLNKVKEFKKGFQDFISKGNIVQLAVAFILGQLFTKVVSSLATDIIMPPINYLFSDTGSSLQTLNWQLKNNIYLNYGIFLQNVFDFLSVSFILYLIVLYYSKYFNKKNQNENKISIEHEQLKILKEIKDILINKNK